MRSTKTRALASAALLTAALGTAPAYAEVLPSGQTITPLPALSVAGANAQLLNPGLAQYPNFAAGQALRAEVSPDGTTLAVLCAGNNSLVSPSVQIDATNSTQWIFLYDISGANAAAPVLKQTIHQQNAHAGLAWSADGSALYATGGSDDAVYVYRQTGGVWTQSAKIALGHAAIAPAYGLDGGLGGFVEANAAGLALSGDGKTLVVANNYNDSISVIDVASNTVRYEHDLRPYFPGNEGVAGGAGGEFPFGVVMKGNLAYVSSARDREVVVVDVSNPSAGQLVTRIKLNGNALGMAFSPNKTRLYVAQDNADQVAVINTKTNAVLAEVDTRGPASTLPGPRYTGAAPLSVRVDRTGQYIFAVNAGSNSVAVISAVSNKLIGLVPTGYEPTDVAVSADNAQLYIINGKSVTGPNTRFLYGDTPRLTTITYPGGNLLAFAIAATANQYQFQLERSSLVTAPLSTVMANLSTLTSQVFANNNYGKVSNPADTATVSFLRQHIKHVIYVVKENRTFDQVLGDLTNGANTDPSLTVFGKAITPNLHALATNFVTLDNFNDPGDGSMDGWSWSMQGRVTNTEAITQQINYAFVDRGLSYESEGTNRNIPVGLTSVADRNASVGGLYIPVSNLLPGGTANLLPGTADHTSTDSPFGVQHGYIFDAALNAGLTVRNYGFLVNNIGPIKDGTGNPITNPGAAGVVQAAALNERLAPFTDVYFRGFDQAVADQYRFNEWNREFQQYVAGGNLPNLSLVRLSHDHTGSFGSALAGVNTPETQNADNDYAVGQLIQAVANSPYARDTVIFITEDDSQDGPDHVDSHRSTAYVVGAYVRKGAVVSTHYSQVNVLRSIEDILRTPHLNLNTAHARPMVDVFDTSKTNAAWTFAAAPASILSTTSLTFAAAGGGTATFAEGPAMLPAHDAAFWDSATRGFDFSKADQVPADLYNRILWNGLKSGQPYPALKSAFQAGLPLAQGK